VAPGVPSTIAANANVATNARTDAGDGARKGDRARNGDGARGGDGDGDDDGVSEMVAGCVRLLGYLIGRSDVLQLSEGGGAGGDRGVTPALAERAIRHCLRHAPAKLLTEEVYDAALRAALDTTGIGGISSGGGGGSGGGSGSSRGGGGMGGGGGEDGGREGSHGTPCAVASDAGAEAFARELTLSNTPCRSALATSTLNPKP
jgi:hypothetical protein